VLVGKRIFFFFKMAEIQDGGRVHAFAHIDPLAADCLPDSEKLYFEALALQYPEIFDKM
jgi:hypothetical protein